MLVKGKSIKSNRYLARHLLNGKENDEVIVLENDHPSQNLTTALKEWQHLSKFTKGTKGLYHANINPDAKYDLTREQWFRAAEALEEALGLQGHPKAIVLHQKSGRAHIHVVWERVDTETMTLKSDSHNYKKHEAVARLLEQEFGHDPVKGVHDRAPGEPRPERDLTHAEWQAAERSGLDPKQRKADITALYHASDSGAALKSALQEHGYLLAQGKRRALTVVDSAGDVHALNRQIQGVRAKEIKRKIGDLDSSELPRASHLQAQIRNKERSTGSRRVKKALPDYEAQARAMLHRRRVALKTRLRDERKFYEAYWKVVREEERQGFKKYLMRSHRTERLQDFWNYKPKTLNGKWRHFWHLLQRRVNPHYRPREWVEPQQKQAHLRRLAARDIRDKKERRVFEANLASWVRHQRKVLARNHASRRHAFEGDRQAELERLEAQARHIANAQRVFQQRASRAASRDREGHERDREPPVRHYRLHSIFHQVVHAKRLSKSFNRNAKKTPTQYQRPQSPVQSPPAQSRRTRAAEGHRFG